MTSQRPPRNVQKFQIAKTFIKNDKIQDLIDHKRIDERRDAK